MSNRRSNWMTSSLPRPTALNSPSLGRLSDIKGRLSFSAIKTPAFKPKQRSLMEHARSSGSPVNGYHMSKQNPDVLDRLCSPSPSHRDNLLHKKTLSPAMVRVGAGSSMLMSTRNGHQAPGQSSLVKQMLNDKHRAPTSLVHLATRGKTFRSGMNVSPVVVKLSGAAAYDLPSNSSSLNSSREEGSSTENGAEANSRSTNGEGSPVKTRDPCDKNVVLSALRQRRKRWATSGPDDDGDQNPSTSDSGAPLAKRTKHSSQDPEAQRPFNKHKSPLSYILGDRKRAYTAPSYSMSPDSKKSRLGTEGDSGLVAPVPVRGLGGGGRVSLPDFECDGDSEVSEYSEAGERESQSGGTSSKASSRAPSECIGGLEGEQRSLTPPVQFDEVEINRKREESLSNLKAVFSPKGGEKRSTNRRKLPIFCATGNKPHLPTPLSTTHTVTLEDLKKDREAAAAKLREILAAEDPPPQTTESMTSLTSLPSQTTLSLSTATAGSTSKDTSNLLSGVRLSSSLSGSLPSLPSASSVTKNSSISLLSTASGGSLSLAMPKSTPPAQNTSAASSSVASSANLTSSALPKSSLAQTTTAVPPSTQPLQIKSVSFAPLPTPTPVSTTQASFSFALNGGSQVISQPAGQPAASTTSTVPSSTAVLPPQTGLTLGTNASISTAGTQLQLPQFPSTLMTTTTNTASAGNALNTNATLQNSQASTGGGGGGGSGVTQPQGINFTPQQSVGFSLTGPGSSSNGPQLSIFQGGAAISSSSASNSVPSTTSATTLAQGAAGGSIFSGANSTVNPPSTAMSGGFTFALPTTTQQQSQQQQSNSLFQKPTSSVASSSANTNGIFGMSSGLQMPAMSQSQQQSSTGPNAGLIFQAQPQQQQQQQPSIFGGAQAQSSQNSSGISFNFSQTPANNGGSGLAASSNTGLNFTAATQPAQGKNPTFNFSAGLNSSGQQQQKSASGGSGLKLNTGSQPSGGGLSLFNSKPGNGQQQQNQSSIFSAGGVGTSTPQQPSQPTNSTGGLFNNQQQNTASGFTGFNNSQTQQQGSSTVFPSFNASGQPSGSSTGFNFSAGASNIGGGGLFQKAGSTPGQTNNQLPTGNSTQKSGVSFNFSASAMGNQQQQAQQQQPQQSQSQGGVFAFGQKPNSSSGFNFSTNGSTGLGLGNQTQNGSSGFSFSAGMGMNPGGGAGSTGGVFNNSTSSSNIFQNQVQQPQPNSNVFQTPQPPQKQLSFATPTNQPGQGGFNFPVNPSGLNNISFSAGTPGDSRPVARARRRKK